MGCKMSRDINRGAMVKGGTAVTHSTFDLQQTKIFESSSFSNRKHHCTTLPSNVTEIKQRNLAASLETPDHNYCRIHSKFFECGGTLTVSKQQGPIRMETLPKSISASLPEEGNPKSRFVCSKTVSQTTPVFCLETWTFQSGDRCPTTDLGQSITSCISPSLPYSASLEESDLQPHRKYAGCHTNLAVLYLIPPSTRNVYNSSTATSKERKLNKPTRISSSCFVNRTLWLAVWNISGKDFLKSEFQKQLPNLLQASTRREESNFTKFHSQITIRPG